MDKRTITISGDSSSKGGSAVTKTKGQARREFILKAAIALLETASLEDLTYPAICGRAGVPESSAYHFFPELPAIYRALLGRFGKAHDKHCQRNLTAAQRANWKAILSMFQYGILTPLMIERDKIAAISFMQHYVGEALAVRPERELASVTSIAS